MSNTWKEQVLFRPVENPVTNDIYYIVSLALNRKPMDKAMDSSLIKVGELWACRQKANICKRYVFFSNGF